MKDGKCVPVARNRHKAEGQITDSLEEYMEKYAGSHTSEECMGHLKSLVVKPAERTYFSHRYGKWCSIHAGDVVLYEKHNKIKGTTKHGVFVTIGIRITDGYVLFGSKFRKVNYCRTLQSSCTPFVDKVVI